MARVNRDVNDPTLYAPRETPRVQPAQRRANPPVRNGEPTANETPAGKEYLFDEDEAWNEPLEELPAYRPKRNAAQAGRAVNAGNPYAKKRASQAAGARRKPGEDDVPYRWKGRPFVYAGVIVICMAILAFLGVMMMPQMAGYFWKDLDNYAFINGEILRYDREVVNNYKQYRDYLKQDIIYQGIFVDNRYVGGLTLAEAEAALGGNGSSTTNAFSVTVAIGNMTWDVNNTNVPATRNLDSVLRRAYAVGRGNTTATIGTQITPFRERVNTVLGLLNNYMYLKSDTSYDHDAVRAKVDEIAAYVTRDPVDSKIDSFDFNARTFTFTEDQVGIAVDADALYNQIIQKLDAGALYETITVEPTVTTPAITKAELMNSFKLVAAFTTDTTSSSSRNNNIELACEAVNGTVLLPGQSFSFNATTGERTASKGYQMAGAISGGELIEDYGGGVCQVSSTLFNAVARADLEVTSRSPHAWPSTYVKIGEDATVDWPNLDFQFKNSKATPVFVIMYYKNRKCTAEIWGMTLGTGVTIDLESKTIRTIEPSSAVNYVQNTSLPVGTSKQTIKARTGYVVETYKVWYQDGMETKRELLHTSTYKAYQRTVEYN